MLVQISVEWCCAEHYSSTVTFIFYRNSKESSKTVFVCSSPPNMDPNRYEETPALCYGLSFLRQPLQPLECDTPWAGLDFVALSSSPPPYSAKTAVFCIFVFCFEANTLRILCQPLRRLEAPRGAVNQGWESLISHRKKAQEKQAISIFQNGSAIQRGLQPSADIAYTPFQGQSRLKTPLQDSQLTAQLPALCWLFRDSSHRGFQGHLSHDMYL